MTRIPRIYFNGILKSGEITALGKEESHYWLNVLRAQIKDEIYLFNGQGGQYLAELVQITKQSAVVLVKNFLEIGTESPLKIHLGQGVSRGERMDYALQKSIELGVFEITPLLTERCEVKIKADRLENRMQHWKKIIISACEQSGRCFIPKINPPQILSTWLNTAPGLRFVCDPKIKTNLPTDKQAETVSLLIGPEGGLSETEIQSAKSNDFASLSLGPRILRTETAAVAAITLLQSCWGDI